MKSIKTICIKATCLLAFIFASNSIALINARAQVSPHSYIDGKGDIRCISAENGLLVFELNLKNLPAKGSALQVTDEAGNIILEEQISTSTFNVRYKIERNNISKLVFEVSGKKLRLNKTFSINSRMEEKIDVVKL